MVMDMYKRRARTSKSDRLMILEESFKTGITPQEVESKYKIPVATLHNWRSIYRRQQRMIESEGNKTKQSGVKSQDFVEVQISSTKEVEVPSPLLKQVSLDFTDYIVQITGKIDDKVIDEILRISGSR